MLLREIVEKKHFLFAGKAEGWEDSIRMACSPLVETGVVTKEYADEIIACVHKHGPYIAIMPGFALPHSMENSEGALQTAIGFMKLEEEVVFDPDDVEKRAKVFFTLSSIDHDTHLKNMRKLFKMLTNEDLCEDLLQVTKPEDLMALAEKYNIVDAE